MGKIFKEQTKLYIELTMQIDLSTAVSSLIKYKKPNGQTGGFFATIKDTTNGILEYHINTDGTDIDQSGKWLLWAYVSLTDGSILVGESVAMNVYDEGE